MPRREGAFLFCWTAMVLLLSSSVSAVQQALEARERRKLVFSLLLLAPRRAALRMAWRVRQREYQLVLDQLAQRHVLARQQPVGRFRVGRIGVNLGLARRKHQRFFLIRFEAHRFEAALTSQLQRAPHTNTQARATASVAQPFDLVGNVSGVRCKQVAQPGKSPDRHRALLNCAGRCELESVYDRMMRRLVRHKREMIPSAKITVKTK